MKKLIIAAAILLGTSASIFATGGVHIHYKGGMMCWLGGDGCEGSIDINWLTVAPGDINPMQIPSGYQLMSMTAVSFTKANTVLPGARTFVPSETSDHSTIVVPKQTAFYSKSTGLYYVYAQKQ